MLPLRRARRPLPLGAVALLTAASMTGCATADEAPRPESPGGTTSAVLGRGPAGTRPLPLDGTLPPAATPSDPAASPARPATCAARLADRLDDQQRAGQLVMIGVTQGGGPAAERAIRRHGVGNVFFIGGWQDRRRVRATADGVQRAAREGSRGIRALVGADQEGGQILQLRGEGFTRTPSAVEQARLSSAQRRALATTTGRELAAAGVNLDLAPVADTVAPELGRANGPVGRWDRGFGTDPAQVTGPVADVISGLHSGGVGATLKHFPGLGRVRANTDTSARGITDERTWVEDPVLQPFASGIAAGADAVMVSTAHYPRIDPDNHAAFSRTVVTSVLREQMGYRGVVVTDDLGIAASVAAVPTGQRAVRAVRAGGDITLTGRDTDGQVMVDALVAESRRDPDFRRQLHESARRVLDLKVRRGLATCR